MALKVIRKSQLTGFAALVAGAAWAAAPGLSAADELDFHLVLDGGAVVGGPPTLQVTEGDDVTIELESDDAMEIHLHGYDLPVVVVPDQTVALSFRADIVGRFPAEPHDHDGAHRPALFYIEVYPK